MTMRMSIPIEDRAPAPSLADRALAWWRLFLIEFRRSPAIIAALAIAAVTAWLMWDHLPAGVVRWLEVSSSASDALIPASALAAGIAAFVTGRDERLHLEDQLIQTSLSSVRRDVVAMLATMVWCLAGYLTVVVGFFVYAAMHATWAGPTWSFVTLSAAAIVLGVSIGWLVGIVFRNRLSPLVAVVITVGLHAAYSLTGDLRRTDYVVENGMTNFRISESSIRFLLPFELLDFYVLRSVMLTGFVWVLGLSGILAAIAWWIRHRTIASLIVLSVSAMTSGISAAELLGNNPYMSAHRTGVMYVDPVCEQRLDGRISICLHPQDESLLDDTADAVETLLAPIVGITGVPAIYENQPAEAVLSDPNRLQIHVYDQTGIPNYIYSTLLRELLHDFSAPLGHETGSAQWVIGAWLIEEAGLSQSDSNGTLLLRPAPPTARVDAARANGVTDYMALQQYADVQVGPEYVNSLHAAVDRFAALSPEQQRAWLEANWDDLRAGNLTLEDLP